MAIPSKVKPGDPIKASDWNLLIEHLRSSQILPSAGVRVTRTGCGTVLAVQPQVGGGRVSVPTHPFKINASKTDNGFEATITFGTVNGIEPTISGQFLHDVLPDPPTLTVENNSIVYIKANLDSTHAVQSAEIDVASDLPDNSNAESYLMIGRVVINGDAISVFENVNTSLGLRLCPNPFTTDENHNYNHLWWAV